MQQIKKNQGIALLAAIMVVALVAITSIQMISQRQLQILRTANIQSRDQAYLYALGVEQWAKSILFQDLLKDKQNHQVMDTHQESWYTHKVLLDVGQARISGQVTDLQKKININNLLASGKPDSLWIAAYKRLLQKLQFSTAEVEGLTASLVDWLDKDQQLINSLGAEDSYYLRLEPPYRSADRPLLDVSELLLIKGYSQAVYLKLKAYICTVSEITPINVNTASKLVLQSIIPALSDKETDELIRYRKTAPFADIETFMKHKIIIKKAVDPRLLSVASKYFQLSATAVYGQSSINLNSHIKRDDTGEVTVFYRREDILRDMIHKDMTAKDVAANG